MPDPHLDADHVAPERTTPQGTQAYGVEHGHEERDVKYRPLLGWFIGLAVAAGLIHLLLWGMFELLLYTQRQQDQVPSALFAEQPPPPPPRLIPNPIDYPQRPTVPLPGPVEVFAEYQAREFAEMTELGLWNAGLGVPTLPREAVAEVIAEYGGPARPEGAAPGWPPIDGLSEIMPSDPSGGRSPENWLR